MAALSPHYGSKTSSSLPSPPLSPRTHNAALASYSPEGVEEEFCELRNDGVLGSSGLYRGTLQGKEGDVVLLLPALPNEGVKLLQEEIP
jgi:hypothetical protein